MNISLKNAVIRIMCIIIPCALLFRYQASCELTAALLSPNSIIALPFFVVDTTRAAMSPYYRKIIMKNI